MVKKLGVEFAPIDVPFARRLQTAAVIFFVLDGTIIGPGAVIFLIWLATTQYYWISCLYLAWYVYDRNSYNQGGRKWTFFRHFPHWKHFRDYFPIKLVKTAEIDPSHNYIFSVHPHGIICYGIFGNFATEANRFSQLFPGLRARLLTLQEQFFLPFHREMLLWLGVCSATRPSMDWLLTKEGKGNALVLIPGGAVEALDAIPGKFDITLENRKGFCRMALKHGAHLVPVLSFGENEVYSQTPTEENSLTKRVQKFLTKKLHISPPIFYGRGVFQYTFGMIPYRRPITTVVGKPIPVEKVEGEPTKEAICTLHEKYCQILTDMYNEHKSKYGFEEVQLNIK